MSDDINYDQIDPGIRETVRKLNEAGFVTTDSGDGVHKFSPDFSYENGNKPDGHEVLDYPHVVIQVELDNMVSETDRLFNLVKSWGLDIWEHQVQLTYCPGQSPMIMLSGVNDQGIVEDEMMILYKSQREAHCDNHESCCGDE